MIITQTLLDSLTSQARSSDRLRMNYDLRNSDSDQSQRMLNAIEPGSIIPIHRHHSTSETVVIIRGHAQELLYDKSGHNVEEVVDLIPEGEMVAINVPQGQWHTVRSLESGTIIIECKDGRYEPMNSCDVMNISYSS